MVGLARAGGAAVDALAAHAGPAAVAAWDASTSPRVAEVAAKLTRAGIRAEVGGDGTALLEAPSPPACVVKSPGVPADVPLLRTAQDRSIPVLDEAEIGWRLDRRPMVGVTGTNGKSTVCALASVLLEANGETSIVAGNTAFGPPLTALVAEPAAAVVVAELSSFQLAGSPELLPEAAVFTNLSDDHWEHHGSRGAYVAAKRRLFVRGDRCAGVVAVNADDPEGSAIAGDVESLGGRAVTFGRSACDVRVEDARWTLTASTIRFAVRGREVVVASRLPGAHNAMNVAGAIALSEALELDLERSARAIESCDPVPGRLEPVDEGQPFAVIVDYAHNPAGVRAVLETVRGVAEADPARRVVVVASGLAVLDERQHRATGRALAGADEVILSLERMSLEEPRDEPPAGLLDGVRAAGSEATVIPDRGDAIRHAVGLARPGDVVLILNRGARRTPLLDARDESRPVDDRDEARMAIQETLG